MPLDSQPAKDSRQRWRIQVSGAVQGVGFRPAVYRYARSRGLTGWVANTSGGLLIEAEGSTKRLRDFVDTIETTPPPHAVIRDIITARITPARETAFVVRENKDSAPGDLLVLPDLATCADCLSEVFDPADRRYLYPFTNCTSCGPRYSIINALPYDRAETTMAGFDMCPRCRAEYETPADRRFHAQPNACPDCGPQLALWNADGSVRAARGAAIAETVAQIQAGAIVAIKGLGGFHLLVDATNSDAVDRLRVRKNRPDKPFAVMVPDLGSARALTEISTAAEQALVSAAAPIVLLRRRIEAPVAASVAPGNPDLGVMLPYTPLHHILLQELGHPVVATSGNLSDEPIATDENEALQRLAGIADLFLVHDRPIRRPVEDSVVRILGGQVQMLRRGRGHAPFPVTVAEQSEGPTIVAVGAHLKNTTGILKGAQFFTSPHIGDMGTCEAEDLLHRTTADLAKLAQVEPTAVACDLHPDYASTRHAERCGLPLIRVQHHVAHVMACASENNLREPFLGIAWDGTGLGTDNTSWGGEFIGVEPGAWQRIAYLRPFALPGGDAAAREPRRAAVGLLYAAFGATALTDPDLAPVRSFSPAQRQTLARALANGLNTLHTSSMGRLFDGVAALLGVRQKTTYEGQAAIELEWLARDGETVAPYDFRIDDGAIDWRPMLTAIVADLRAGTPAQRIAAAFHSTLVEIILAVARKSALPQVVLTGGCFQNRLLTEAAIDRLRAAGFAPYWHRQVPPNDGGLALGQAVWARRQLAGGAGCA